MVYNNRPNLTFRQTRPFGIVNELQHFRSDKRKNGILGLALKLTERDHKFNRYEFFLSFTTFD